MARQSTLVLIVALLSSPVLAAPAAAPASRPTTRPAPASRPALDPDEPITIEAIKAVFDAGDYQESLRLLGRVLALKGKAADGYDRYELHMLKGESHLRLKANSMALESFATAASAAPDEKAAADARALAMLVKRSKNLQFTPKAAGAGKGAAIDITDAKRRPEALEALYLEEKALAKPKVLAADKGKTLPPIATALKSVQELRDLELAATGKTAETADTIGLLTDRAHTLMAKNLDDMTKRTARIAERANEVLEYESIRSDGTREMRTARRGLDRHTTTELKEIVTTSKRIGDSSKELAEGFRDNAEPFEDLEDLARDTQERANDVLTDNYSRVR
jgi:hypothetical protein